MAKKQAIVVASHIAAITALYLNREFVYFTKGDDISVLNKVLIYVQEMK